MDRSRHSELDLIECARDSDRHRIGSRWDQDVRKTLARHGIMQKQEQEQEEEEAEVQR